MGVIKKSSISNSVSDSIEDVLEDLQHEEVEQEPEILRPKKTKHRAPKPDPIGGHPSGKAKGGKKKKRVENSNFLLSLVESDEGHELTIHDFVPHRASAFTQLFLYMDHRELWHDFLNCSKESEEWYQQNVKLKDQSRVTKYDLRNDHPASQCYQKIDFNIRLMLKRKHVPLGPLLHLESEVVGFFECRPDAIFHCQGLSSFERLLLHAIAQYLGLHSLSYDRSGSRWTRVRNKSPDFCLPPVLLSSYLQDRQQRHS